MKFVKKKDKPVYWEYKDGENKKFWAAHIFKKDDKFYLIRKWGKVGEKNQNLKQKYSTYKEALSKLNDLIWRKENKGYKPVF